MNRKSEINIKALNSFSSQQLRSIIIDIDSYLYQYITYMSPEQWPDVNDVRNYLLDALEDESERTE
jgi:hypothetical protein